MSYREQVCWWLRTEAERLLREATAIENGAATHEGCWSCPDWQEEYLKFRKLMDQHGALVMAVRALETLD